MTGIAGLCIYPIAGVCIDISLCTYPNITEQIHDSVIDRKGKLKKKPHKFLSQFSVFFFSFEFPFLRTAASAPSPPRAPPGKRGDGMSLGWITSKNDGFVALLGVGCEPATLMYRQFTSM